MMMAFDPHHSNVPLESYWARLFAKLSQKKNIEDLILNVGIGCGSPAAVPNEDSGALAAAPAAEEKKKEEEMKEESDDEPLFGLFD